MREWAELGETTWCSEGKERRTWCRVQFRAHNNGSEIERGKTNGAPHAVELTTTSVPPQHAAHFPCRTASLNSLLACSTLLSTFSLTRTSHDRGAEDPGKSS
mgnify:CR=1 FL=1